MSGVNTAHSRDNPSLGTNAHLSVCLWADYYPCRSNNSWTCSSAETRGMTVIKQKLVLGHSFAPFKALSYSFD